MFCRLPKGIRYYSTKEKLYHKLNKHYLAKNSKIFRIIVSMYENGKSCITHRSIKSNFFDCEIGVRQGENLSPLLFSLYVNDLENFTIKKIEVNLLT